METIRIERLSVAVLALVVEVAACSRKPAEPASTREAGAPVAASTERDAGAEAGIDRPLVRAPEWDLDASDPERDMVERYVKTTNRYGDKTRCVSAQRSAKDADPNAVVVRDDPARCPGGGNAVRDVFLAKGDGGGYTLKVASTYGPLAKWPDGSELGGTPNEVRVENRMKDWSSPLHKAFTDAKLSPFRVEFYGHGSYPVVALAGWRDPIVHGVSSEKVRPFARKLCEANGDMPLGIFGGVDRNEILRVKCPSGETRWETLR